MEFKCFGLLVVFMCLGLNKADVPVSIMRSLQKCLDKGGLNGVVNCAGLRTLNMMRSLSQKDSLEVVPGIVLQRDNSSFDIPEKIADEDLPLNPVNRSEKILQLLGDETLNLISRRTLTVKLPKINSDELSRALKGEEEGRGRKKNRFGSLSGMMGPLMISMAAKLFALIGGVGLLSAKAIVVAKLALLISFILFAQSYFSNRGTNILPPYYGGNSYYPSVTYGTNNLGGWNPQYPYARSLEVDRATTESYEGEQLAYKGFTSNSQ